MILQYGGNINDVIEMLPSILTMIIVFNTEVSMSGTCDL